MSKKTKELSFEERLARIQTIVAALESGESPLEESVALYKEGLAHTRACREQLARARHDIEIYQNGACAPFVAEQAEDGRSADDTADGEDKENDGHEF